LIKFAYLRCVNDCENCGLTPWSRFEGKYLLIWHNRYRVQRTNESVEERGNQERNVKLAEEKSEPQEHGERGINVPKNPNDLVAVSNQIA
jgi:hypothetical protein